MPAGEVRLENLTSSPLSVDLDFGQRRQIHKSIPSGGFVRLNDQVSITYDEALGNQGVQRLLSGTHPKAKLYVTPGLGTVSTIRVDVRAGTGVGADDVVLTSPLGKSFRLVDAEAYVTTAAAGSTWTVRTARGGTGNALTSDMSTAAVATVESEGVAGGIASQGPTQRLYLRRSNRVTAGTIVLKLLAV